MRDEIGQRFRANLERVRGLVLFYEESVPGGPGRKVVPAADLLRAAVVLLHATLEDLLRSLAGWKLPTAPASSLERFPIGVSPKPKEKITLVELAEFRGQTVDSVIAQSVEAYLERSSYNHPGEVVELLVRIGVAYPIPAKARLDLAAMMSRRHKIAHQTDRNPFVGPGHQSAQSISVSTVALWIKTVEKFGESVLKRA